MGNAVSQQLSALLWALAFGLLCGAWYDFLRALRLKGKKRWVESLLDILFCLSCTAGCLSFALRLGGELRLFVLLGVGLGAGVYFLLVRGWMQPIWRFWADCLQDFLHLLLLPLRAGAALSKKIMHFSKRLFHFYVKCFIIKHYR